MTTPNKILTLLLSLMSVSTLVHASQSGSGTCVDGARIIFNFWHAPAKPPFSQPEAGNVFAHIKAYNKGFLYNYSAETSEQGMIVSGSGNADFTQCGNPYGLYQIEIRCSGSKKFSGQEPARHSTLFIPPNPRSPDGRSLSFVVACPVNDLGTTLLAPQIIETKFYE